MSDNAQQAVNPAETEIRRKIEELTQLSRVVGNGLAFLADQDCKIAHLQPVGEFISFLQGFRQNVQAQKATLESTLPKPVVTPEIVEPSPVTAEVK